MQDKIDLDGELWDRIGRFVTKEGERETEDDDI